MHLLWTQAWGNIPGYALGFSLGAEASFLGKAALGITVYTSLPQISFSCKTQDFCGNHETECVTILGQRACVSTNLFCPAVDALKGNLDVDCNTRDICLNDVSCIRIPLVYIPGKVAVLD